MKNRHLLTKKLITSIFALVFTSGSAAFAVSAGDLSTIKNGTVNFDTPNKTTTITTNIGVPSTEVNWNKFNVGCHETVINSFSSANQTIINRVIGNDLSTIAGTISAAGLGAASGHVVLINPNGIIFNGATINVASLVASTLNTEYMSFNPNHNVIQFRNGSAQDIKIYNATINTQYGASFFTKGNIDVRNSNITADKGDVTLRSANAAQWRYWDIGPVDVAHPIDSDNNVSNAGQIGVSKSNITARNGDVIISTNSSYAADSDIIIYGSSAIKAPKGWISVDANNNSYITDPTHTYHSNLKYYPDIKDGDAVLVTLAGTSKVVANDVMATKGAAIIGQEITVNNLGASKTGELNYVLGGRYNVKKSAGTYFMGTEDKTIKDTVPEDLATVKTPCQIKAEEEEAAKKAAEEAAKKAAEEEAAKKAAEEAAKKAAEEEAAKKAAEEAAKKAAEEEAARRASNPPEKYLPQISTSSTPSLSAEPKIAGAAAKVRHKQSPIKFVGYLNKEDNRKFKYYEILK